MGTIYGREPVLVYMVVQAGITLAVTFGLHLTVEQIGGLLTLTLAILSFIVRGVVTPTSKLQP